MKKVRLRRQIVNNMRIGDTIYWRIGRSTEIRALLMAGAEYSNGTAGNGRWYGFLKQGGKWHYCPVGKLQEAIDYLSCSGYAETVNDFGGELPVCVSFKQMILIYGEHHVS